MTPNNPVAAAILNDLAHGDAFVRMTYQGAAHILPVALRDDVHLADLLGIDAQKTALLANLDHFLDGKPCQHMLLWGARGTGKSSLIRAALLHYRARGLKSLPIACDDLADLPSGHWHTALPRISSISTISPLVRATAAIARSRPCWTAHSAVSRPTCCSASPPTAATCSPNTTATTARYIRKKTKKNKCRWRNASAFALPSTRSTRNNTSPPWRIGWVVRWI